MIAAAITGDFNIFVAIDLDDICQMSYDTHENLNTVFNEYLYIPIPMGGSSKSKSQLLKKSYILLLCFNQVEVENDYLESAEIQLSKTESANEFTDPIGVNALAIVYTPYNGLLLTSCGQPTFKGSKIYISCFCLPNFPSQLHLDPPESQNPRNIHSTMLLNGVRVIINT
ncbi:MAG: hypothetical protein EZS28_017031 [Streblomastix strix]|uniref:Uncharacterized protein n=1 Tax=Streblomastix strix TaxID=222440 RepID=A0A5J4VY38_9EUKA|nr:MAG: hypothetical protein EZS28_017031 [Streblomastix strix]